MQSYLKFLKYLYLVCFGLLVLAQLVNLKFLGLGEIGNFYLFDIAVLFFCVFGVIFFINYKLPVYVNTVVLLFSFFTLWALFSLVINNISHSYEGFYSQFFYLVRWVSYFLASVLVVNLIRLKLFSLDLIVKSVIVSGLVLTFLGFIQLILLPDFTVLPEAFGWDPHKNRLASTFFDPNFTGAYIVVAISICLGLFYENKVTVFRKRTLLLIMGFLTLGLFFTFSRSAWGMMGVVILVFGIFKYRLMLLLSLVVAFATFFAVPRVQTRLTGITDPSDSAHFRVISWKTALNIFETSPVFGVGFNSYRVSQKELGLFQPGDIGGNSGAGADSSFLFVLATTGLIGVFLFYGAYSMAIVSALRKLPKGGIYCFVILSALFLESTFINSVFYPQLMFVWLTFALSENS